MPLRRWQAVSRKSASVHACNGLKASAPYSFGRRPTSARARAPPSLPAPGTTRWAIELPAGHVRMRLDGKVLPCGRRPRSGRRSSRSSHPPSSSASCRSDSRSRAFDFRVGPIEAADREPKLPRVKAMPTARPLPRELSERDRARGRSRASSHHRACRHCQPRLAGGRSRQDRGHFRAASRSSPSIRWIRNRSAGPNAVEPSRSRST